jgi:YidC/Oxa1 family membrane protein insertase
VSGVLLAILAIANPLEPLEDALAWALERFHDLGLTWAWSIVALTITVRIILVPLTIKQIHSMQNLQRHAPEMKEIQRKYKGDRQKMNEEMMRFYRENKINPAASCLPLLAQLPVFFALFFVLQEFSNNPPPGSLSWLGVVPSIAENTTSHWSGYLLLTIYAASQVLSTWFMSATMDKTQRTIMMVLPLLFIGFIAHFPAGLVLYWVTTNLWTVGQGLVTRRLVPRTPAGGKAAAASNGPKRSSRTPPKSPQPDAQAPPKPAPQPAPRQPRRVKRKGGGARR